MSFQFIKSTVEAFCHIGFLLCRLMPDLHHSGKKNPHHVARISFYTKQATDRLFFLSERACRTITC